MPQTKLEALRQQSNLLMAKVQSLKRSQQELDKMSNKKMTSASSTRPAQKSRAVTGRDASARRKSG